MPNPKFRCDGCGATHKEAVDKCRLCGQQMGPDAMPFSGPAVAQERVANKGLKGAGKIGMGLVLGIVVIGVLFGIVKPPAAVESAKEKLGGKTDGWSVVSEDKGMFEVELPGDRVREEIDNQISDSGKLTAWTAKISTDTLLRVGYGSIATTLEPATTTTGNATTTVMSAAARYIQLREVLIPRYLQVNKLTKESIKLQETSLGGSPALRLKTIQNKLQYNGEDAFGEVVFTIRGKTIYVLEVLSKFTDNGLLDRLIQSFGITGAVTQPAGTVTTGK